MYKLTIYMYRNINKNFTVRHYKNFLIFAFIWRDCDGFNFCFSCWMRSKIFKEGPTFPPVKSKMSSLLRFNNIFPSTFCKIKTHTLELRKHNVL